ncbi:uncharacterized protein LOC141607323 [Silene latifolia]|uniref:uncharacterized protein LOC141607323 n=1 Tax=Silene latifolia TaxID=37657 RepID=UPI003D7716F9
MVSLRRRRLLGLCSGVQNSGVGSLEMSLDNANTAANDGIISSNTTIAPRMLLDDLNLPPREMDDPMEACGSPRFFDPRLDEQTKQQNLCCSSSSAKEPTQVEDVVVVKRRKQYRRKNAGKIEPRIGVYNKNEKWQAAIKVDKKQIHLGTFNSQQEAVQLYDRAAFLCGREPNFELSQEEKEKLRKLKWDDFLATTRSTITTKGTKRRHVVGTTVHSVQSSSDEAAEAAVSTSDDAER